MSGAEALGGAGGSSSAGRQEEPSLGAAAGEDGSGGSDGSGGTAVMPFGGSAGTATFAGSSSVAGGPGGGMPAGGSDGGDPCTYPPVGVTLSEWVDAELQPTPSSAQARVVKGMVGDWFGIVTTPWTAPYAVTLTFSKDDTYSAECVWSSNECCQAFHYGTDDDSELKRYGVEGVTLDGVGYGRIDIVFEQDGSYSESGYQGTLENIALDATLDRMRFEFIYGGQFGPLGFDLQRQGEGPPR